MKEDAKNTRTAAELLMVAAVLVVACGCAMLTGMAYHREKMLAGVLAILYTFDHSKLYAQYNVVQDYLNTLTVCALLKTLCRRKT